MRLHQQNDQFFGYDANGNMAPSNNDTFVYTPDNQIETATVQGSAATYTYDADGWRAKTVTPGATSYTLRGSHGELLTESRNPGAASPSTRDYIYAGTRLLSVITVDGTAP